METTFPMVVTTYNQSFSTDVFLKLESSDNTAEAGVNTLSMSTAWMF
jgi:hypothetical protein